MSHYFEIFCAVFYYNVTSLGFVSFFPYKSNLSVITKFRSRSENCTLEPATRSSRFIIRRFFPKAAAKFVYFCMHRFDLFLKSTQDAITLQLAILRVILIQFFSTRSSLLMLKEAGDFLCTGAIFTNIPNTSTWILAARSSRIVFDGVSCTILSFISSFQLHCHRTVSNLLDNTFPYVVFNVFTL